MNKLINLFTGVFGLILRLLPTHTKRMMFMASYVTQSYRRNHDEKVEVDPEILARLDKLFDLCNDGNASAMQMPNALSKVIMKGVVIYDVEKPVSTVEAIAMAKDVKDQVPAWLRYDGIETDTAEMLQRMPVAV